jgi:hypothetical protein
MARTTYTTRIDTNGRLFGIPLDAISEKLLSPQAHKYFGKLKRVEKHMAPDGFRLTFVSYDEHKFTLSIDEIYALINIDTEPRIGIERIQNPPTHDHLSDAYAMYFNINWNTETAALPEKINTFILAGSLAEARYLAEEILGLKDWKYLENEAQVRSLRTNNGDISVYIYGTFKLRGDRNYISSALATKIRSVEQITDMTE